MGVRACAVEIKPYARVDAHTVCLQDGDFLSRKEVDQYGLHAFLNCYA